MTQTRLSPLKLTKVFRFIYRKGKWAHTALLSVGFCKNTEGMTRVGLRVSRKVKLATARNRLKRQMRRVMDEGLLVFAQPIDMIIVIRADHGPVATARLRADFIQLCQKLNSLCPK